MTFQTEILIIGAGLVPSLVWLFYFLKRDPHPEPRSLLAKTFLMGIILSPIAVGLQCSVADRLCPYINYSFGFLTTGSPAFYAWAALIEEVVKFLAVYFIVVGTPNFDEPVDAMIYMITAGLGFAAIENILVLFRTIPDGASAAVTVWVLRFIGATLLHALASALAGYFLAMAWFFREHHAKLIFIGISVATLFHWAFNLLLWSSDGRLSGLLYVTGLLLAMAFLVSILFVKIKERRSTLINERTV